MRTVEVLATSDTDVDLARARGEVLSGLSDAFADRPVLDGDLLA